MPVDVTPVDSTIWRTAPYSNLAWFWMYRPKVVFQAQVNQSSFSYPISAITYDNVTVGSISDIRPDMTLIVGTAPGKDDLGRQRVRLVPTATTIPIGWSSAGKRDGEIYLADNAYITVLDDYRVWSVIPRILNSGVTYKDFNKPLGTNGVFLPPVANAGPPICEYLPVGVTSVTVTLDASRSFATTPGADIVIYLWEIEGQENLHTETAEVEFTEGFRYVHLTVTDSHGQKHTTHLPVLVANKDTVGLVRDFEISRTVQADGQRATFTVREPIPLSSYPDGTLVMYWEEERYRGVKRRLTGARRNVKFWGWINTNNDRIAVDESTMSRDNSVTLECIDVAGRLAMLPGFPLVLEKRTAPMTWQQTRYTNINFFAHHILHWHSTALSVTDFYFGWQATSYSFPVLDSDGTSLYQQADNRARAIAHRLTCDSTGILRLVGDPQEQRVTDRTSTVMMALNASDYHEIGYARTPSPRLHWMEGAAILVNSLEASLSSVIPVFSIAPGTAPGQGLSSGQKNYQLVKSQTELNERTGHQYARANALHGQLRIGLIRAGDAGIEPAFCEWVTLNIPSTVAAQRGDTMTGSRHLPIEVTYTRDNETASQSVTVVLEEEVIGAPGQTVIPDSITYPPYELPELVIYPIPDWDFASGIDQDAIDAIQEDGEIPDEVIGVALAWNDEGSVVLTDTFLAEEVEWHNIRSNSNGVVVDACGNYDSDNNLYPVRILTRDADGSTCRIYVREVLNEEDWALEHTFTLAGTNPRITEARIRCNRDNTLVAVAWLAEDAIRCIRKADGPWGSAVIVGDSTVTPDTDVHDKSLGLHVDGTVVLCCGKDSSNVYGLYKASGEAGAFSALGGGGLFDTVISSITTGPGGYVYVGSWSADFTPVEREENWDDSGFLLTQTLLGSNPPATIDGDSMEIMGVSELPANAYMYGRWDFDTTKGSIKTLHTTFVLSKTANHGMGADPVTFTADILVKTVEGGTYAISRNEILTPQFSGPSFGIYTVTWLPGSSGSLTDDLDIQGETLMSLEVRVSIAEAQLEGVNVNYFMEFYGYITWDDFIPDKNRLWRIAAYNTAPVWTDILDAYKNAPYHPYGLSANRLYEQDLVQAGGRNGDPLYDGTPVRMQMLLQSFTRGSTWNYHFSGYDWIQNAGDIFIAGGENTFDLFCPTLSLTERFDRLGNFIDVAGYPGKMRGCLLALIPAL